METREYGSSSKASRVKAYAEISNAIYLNVEKDTLHALDSSGSVTSLPMN